VRYHIPLEALIPIPIRFSVVSLEKKNKGKHAKLMRAARDQVEKLVYISPLLLYPGEYLGMHPFSQLSTRAVMLEQARIEVYVEMGSSRCIYMPIQEILAGPAERMSPRSTRQVMHKIWMKSAPFGWPWLNDGRH